ncbi:MAG: hypothetical protein MdMp024_0036 [Bacteroidales bacterium]
MGSVKAQYTSWQDCEQYHLELAVKQNALLPNEHLPYTYTLQARIPHTIEYTTKEYVVKFPEIDYPPLFQLKSRGLETTYSFEIDYRTQMMFPGSIGWVRVDYKVTDPIPCDTSFVPDLSLLDTIDTSVWELSITSRYDSYLWRNDTSYAIQDTVYALESFYIEDFGFGNSGWIWNEKDEAVGGKFVSNPDGDLTYYYFQTYGRLGFSAGFINDIWNVQKWFDKRYGEEVHPSLVFRGYLQTEHLQNTSCPRYAMGAFFTYNDNSGNISGLQKLWKDCLYMGLQPSDIRDSVCPLYVMYGNCPSCPVYDISGEQGELLEEGVSVKYFTLGIPVAMGYEPFEAVAARVEVSNKEEDAQKAKKWEYGNWYTPWIHYYGDVAEGHVAWTKKVYVTAKKYLQSATDTTDVEPVDTVPVIPVDTVPNQDTQTERLFDSSVPVEGDILYDLAGKKVIYKEGLKGIFIWKSKWIYL